MFVMLKGIFKKWGLFPPPVCLLLFHHERFLQLAVYGFLLKDSNRDVYLMKCMVCSMP